MKKVHLLCNAHLDPAWLWRWNEGLAEALSTFRVAADFCEQYDDFVFNHNEALLYEWVEEYEPQLFARIQKLVAAGKWRIMGGWYLQPDCVMTSGESLLSQIELGREYFEEKFGIKPTTAINFDPFGHSRGLVQILAKTGYDSYIFMRPADFKGDFLWEGFDGSRVVAHGIWGPYNSLKGKAVDLIKTHIAESQDETSLCLWGIGNHGGGPSRVDLEAINAYRKTIKEELVHSSAEEYFADINGKELPVVAQSLVPSMVGCYTSMVRIKQAHRRLENKIALTEKIMSYADMQTEYVFDAVELKKAKKALAFCQFHDILPGSAIKPVEEDSLNTLGYGEEIVDRLYSKAFFKLAEGEKAAEPGTIPVLVFNPHPYEIEREWEIGYMLEDQNWNENEVTVATVYDKNGCVVPTQNEKPEATFNLDWIQKISFRAKIAPATITRFDCHLKRVQKDTVAVCNGGQEPIRIANERMQVVINPHTGMIELYEVDGKVLVKDSGYLEVYTDNEDPWGMTVNAFDKLEGRFTLMSDEQANAFIGFPNETLPNVRIVEDGDVRVRVQSFWEYHSSKAIVEYTIPKHDAYIDVHMQLYSNEPNKMIKFRLDTMINGTPYGQTAFGKQMLFSDGKEDVFHKWCAIEGENAHIAIVNNGIYGGSFTQSCMKLSLLRTPVYSAHPIPGRQPVPTNRALRHMDMGEREFSFRITGEENLEREAQLFNETPQLLSFFPSGEGVAKESAVQIDDPSIILSSIRKKGDTYRLTLYNTTDAEREATICIPALNVSRKVSLGSFELLILDL